MILGLVSWSAHAYGMAPTNMKALVQAFEQLSAALGALLGMALGPVSSDPWLVTFYASLSGVMGVSAVGLWVVFRKEDGECDGQDRELVP